jgi:small subunit ribosomal protein S20
MGHIVVSWNCNMPNTKAAKKDLKQTRVKTARNLRNKKELKLAIKEFNKVAQSDKGKATEMMPKVFSRLDKAAKNNLIAKNKASRLKSRLSKKIAISSK